MERCDAWQLPDGTLVTVTAPEFTQDDVLAIAAQGTWMP